MIPNQPQLPSLSRANAPWSLPGSRRSVGAEAFNPWIGRISEREVRSVAVSISSLQVTHPPSGRVSSRPTFLAIRLLKCEKGFEIASAARD